MDHLLPLLSVALGAVNLAFILKILFNDLHYVRDMLEKHLDYSVDRHLEIERRLTSLESPPSADT